MRRISLTGLLLLVPAIMMAQQQGQPASGVAEWQARQAEFAKQDEPRRARALEKRRKEIDDIERRELSTWTYLRPLPQSFRISAPEKPDWYSDKAEARRGNLARDHASAAALNTARGATDGTATLDAINARITLLDSLVARGNKTIEEVREQSEYENKGKTIAERNSIGERPDPNWKRVAEYHSRRVRVVKEILDFEKSLVEEWEAELKLLREQKSSRP